MSDKCLSCILELYNKIWFDGKLPDTWKLAIIIPILKREKDKHSPFSYRPISLTPTISKLMEKMIIKRLNCYLEKNNLTCIKVDLDKTEVLKIIFLDFKMISENL